MDLSINGMIFALVDTCKNIYNACLSLLNYSFDISIPLLGIDLHFSFWEAFVSVGGSVLFGLIIYKIVRWLTL